MAPRMLICDVDGTLLDSRGRLPRGTTTAIRTLVASGVAVALASGRILAGLLPVCARLRLRGPQIAAHGALVATPGGDVLAQAPLSPEDVHAHLAFGREVGAPIILSWARRLVADRLTPAVVAAFGPYDEPIPDVHEDLDAFADAAPLKTTLCLDPGVYGSVCDAAVARFGERYTVTSANERELELLRPEATKGAGARTLAAALGIALAGTAAIGDGPNDIELFRAVGVSAAMGNAGPAVKAAASFVVPSCDEGGVAVAISRLFPDLMG